MVRKVTPPHERFWAKVNKIGPIPAHMPELRACWIWTGYRIRGYGEFQRGRRDGGLVLAHRFAWEEAHGTLETSVKVLHHCDNPPCVRPSHLFLGSDADNARDKVEKGRSPRGERHWRSVLTNTAIVSIRIDVKNGITQRELARQYGVDPSTVSDIVRRKHWSHL